MFGASVESLLLSVQAFSKSMLTEVVIGDSLELVRHSSCVHVQNSQWP